MGVSRLASQRGGNRGRKKMTEEREMLSLPTRPIRLYRVINAVAELDGPRVRLLCQVRGEELLLALDQELWDELVSEVEAVERARR